MERQKSSQGRPPMPCSQDSTFHRWSATMASSMLRRHRLPVVVSSGAAELESLADDDPYSDAISSWDELRSMCSLAYAIEAGSGNVEGIARVVAAEQLGPMSTYEVLQPTSAVRRFSEALDGTLFSCTSVIDSHYRLLKECMIQDDYSLVGETYRNLPKGDCQIDAAALLATASVGAEALESLKEEHEIVVAMLQEMVEGGGFVEEDVKRDYMRAKATVDAVDRVISELQTTVQGFAW